MIDPILRFHRGLWRSPLWVRLWLVLLGGGNIAGAFLYWETPEAKVVPACLPVAMTIMAALTAKFGFSRILGVGHFVWFPLIAWIVMRLPHPDPGVDLWLRIVVGLNAISLAIDVVDLRRWLRGERDEVVPTG